MLQGVHTQHTRARAHTHTHTHMYAHAHAHAHAHAQGARGRVCMCDGRIKNKNTNANNTKPQQEPPVTPSPTPSTPHTIGCHINHGVPFAHAVDRSRLRDPTAATVPLADLRMAPPTFLAMPAQPSTPQRHTVPGAPPVAEPETEDIYCKTNTKQSTG